MILGRIDTKYCWELFQRGLALLGFIVCMPVLLALAVAIRATSSGPALYRQKRPGLAGRSIEILKFRTMYVGADRDLARARRVADDDSMITPLGGVLRSLKLDELPQLWNVIKGDMNLVGPRPIAWPLHHELADAIPDFLDRLSIKPGITSLAQSESLDLDDQDQVLFDWKRRFAIERHYLARKSWQYDCIVIFLTFAHVILRMFQRLDPGLARIRKIRHNGGESRTQAQARTGGS